MDAQLCGRMPPPIATVVEMPVELRKNARLGETSGRFLGGISVDYRPWSGDFFARAGTDYKRRQTDF